MRWKLSFSWWSIKVESDYLKIWKITTKRPFYVLLDQLIFRIGSQHPLGVKESTILIKFQKNEKKWIGISAYTNSRVLISSIGLFFWSDSDKPSSPTPLSLVKIQKNWKNWWTSWKIWCGILKESESLWNVPLDSSAFFFF